MRKTFMYKLYRSKRPKRLHRQINVGGAIHNQALALHRRYDRRYKKPLSLYQLKAHITQLTLLPQYAWWKQRGSQAIQDIIIRIDQGYQRFFHNVKDRKAGKTTQRVGPPTFRKIRQAKSFTLTQAGGKLLGGNRLRIGTITYQFAQSREIDGPINTVTIKRDALGDLSVYCSCLLDEQPLDRAMTGNSAGFDCGLQTSLPGSDGTEHQAPQPFKHGLRRIAQANRHLSRQVKGSRNRHKAQQHLARVHRRVAHLREAFHWDKAHELCQHYDIIRLETLHLGGLKALWGRKVSALGFASFGEMLHHVADKTGTLVQHIDRWCPSTKKCSPCKQVNHHLPLRDRVWTCTFCGVTQQRDVNAAVNINEEGASSSGGECVRLPLAAALVDPRIPRLSPRGVCQGQRKRMPATLRGVRMGCVQDPVCTS